MSDFFLTRPIDWWPHPETRTRHRSQFDSPITATRDLLYRECKMLGATSAVIQIAVTEADIRRDGFLRASARPSHPGVIVSFRSRHGDLEYATDVFDRWEDNLRAIALGLEALRRVDRYGIAKRGEQYRGWAQLPSGRDDEPSAERGRTIIAKHGGLAAALKATHPDHGGDPADLRDVLAAKETPKDD